MSKESEKKITPPEEVIGLLQNSMELAMAQHLTEARDVIRAASIVAESFSLFEEGLFERLGEAVVSKPHYALPAEYDNAYMAIRKRWHKISK